MIISVSLIAITLAALLAFNTGGTLANSSTETQVTNQQEIPVELAQTEQETRQAELAKQEELEELELAQREEEAKQEALARQEEQEKLEWARQEEEAEQEEQEIQAELAKKEQLAKQEEARQNEIAKQEEARKQEEQKRQAELARQAEQARIAASAPEILGTWNFQTVDVSTSWSVRFVKTWDTQTIEISNLNTSSAPNLEIYLSKASSIWSSAGIPGSIKLTALRSAKWSQTYSVPANIDLSQYNSIAIHCTEYNKLFGSASLR